MQNSEARITIAMVDLSIVIMLIAMAIPSIRDFNLGGFALSFLVPNTDGSGFDAPTFYLGWLTPLFVALGFYVHMLLAALNKLPVRHIYVLTPSLWRQAGGVVGWRDEVRAIADSWQRLFPDEENSQDAVDTRERLSAFLRDARRNAAMSQQHLAEASGVTARTIQRAEASGRISMETLRSLCAVFNVPTPKIADLDAIRPITVLGSLFRFIEWPLMALLLLPSVFGFMTFCHSIHRRQMIRLGLYNHPGVRRADAALAILFVAAPFLCGVGILVVHVLMAHHGSFSTISPFLRAIVNSLTLATAAFFLLQPAVALLINATLRNRRARQIFILSAMVTLASFVPLACVQIDVGEMAVAGRSSQADVLMISRMSEFVSGLHLPQDQQACFHAVVTGVRSDGGPDGGWLLAGMSRVRRDRTDFIAAYRRVLLTRRQRIASAGSQDAIGTSDAAIDQAATRCADMIFPARHR